jgi:hypothetical protein
MVFKSIRGSWSVAAVTCIVDASGQLVKQDHPAYIPCTGLEGRSAGIEIRFGLSPGRSNRLASPRQISAGDDGAMRRLSAAPGPAWHLPARPWSLRPAPPPHRTDCCRSIRRSEGVKDRFACTFTRNFSPVLVALRKHRSLMPQRRRIIIRRQSGGGICTFHDHVAVDHVAGTTLAIPCARRTHGDGARGSSSQAALDGDRARVRAVEGVERA